MADEPTDQTTDDQQHDDQDAQGQDDAATATDQNQGTDWQAEAEKWKTLSRKNEQRARENAGAAAELAQVRQAHMTEQERAVHDAREEGRAAALAEFGSRLVDARFEAAAAGRTVNGRPLDVAALLEGVNRSYYLTDTGEVDVDKVTRFVDNVAPAVEADAPQQQRRFPDLGQGRRTTSQSSTADQFGAAVGELFR